MWAGQCLLLGGGLVQLLLHFLGLLHEVIVCRLDLRSQFLVGGLHVAGDLLGELLSLLQ